MAVSIARQVLIDFGRDGTYGHASADVSAYVLNASFAYGFASPLEEVAPPATLALTLGNFAGEWWQDNATATFYDLLRPGLWIKLTYTYSGTAYQVWEGRLVPPVRYDANPYSGRTVTIYATDEMDALNAQDYVPPLARDTTADVEIRRALEAGALAYPYHEDCWILGASTLGVNTRLPDISGRISLEAGIETLDYAGAFSGGEGGSTAGQYLRELVASERGGRFFWDAQAGVWTFHNRRHGLTDVTSTRTITQDDIQAADVSWSAGLANRVSVNYALLQEGAASGVVWSADNVPFMIKRGESKEFWAGYRDTSNDAIRVAAVDYVLPVAGTDWTANTNPDGTWLDMTKDIAVYADFRADGARVRIINNSPYNDAYITALQLRATPLTALDNQRVERADASSISANGYYPLAITIPWISDGDLADSYASWLLLQFSNTETRFHSITVAAEHSATSALAALANDVGDRITVQETWSGHDADYFVIGKRSEDDGRVLRCTLLLRPVSTVTGWVLGVAGRSELGESTYLVH